MKFIIDNWYLLVVALASGSMLLWPSLLSLLALWGGGEAKLAQGWTLLLVTLPWLLMTVLSLWRWNALRWPLGNAFDSVRRPLQCVLFALLSAGWLFGQLLPGDAAPLPWVPVLNPAEVGQWLSLLLLARWLYSGQVPQALLKVRLPLLALAGFIALTSLVLHGVHQWGGLAWNSSMARYSLAQTSLTVLWSVLGVIAWVWGSRRGQRVLWMVGAVLMGVGGVTALGCTVGQGIVGLSTLSVGSAIALAGMIAGAVLADPTAAIGRIARRPLQAGSLLSSNDLVVQRLIKRGDNVALVSRRGSVEVRIAGRAMGDAGENERVSVENLSSRRIVQGTVDAAGDVIVAR